MLLTNRREPLANRRRSAVERAQVLEILTREGFGSLADAAKDPELRLVAVDVVVDGAPIFALYVWPSGSGVLFRAGTTERCAEITHHELAWVGANDARHEALAAAFTAATKALDLEEVDFVPRKPLPSPRTEQADAPVDVLQALAQIPTSAATVSEQQQIAPLLEPLIAHCFGRELRRYPKRRLADLDEPQRALIERMAAVRLGLERIGLFDPPALNLRFLGLAAPGPTDSLVQVPGETAPLPLWNAVSDMATGVLSATDLSKAWRAIPPAAALAAWQEIVRGEAYDLLIPHGRTDRECEIPQTPGKTKYWTRLFGFLVDENLALGEPGRAANDHLPAELSLRWQPAMAFVYLLTCARRSKHHAEPLPAGHDDVHARLANEPNRAGPERYSWVYAPPLEKLLGLGQRRT